MKKILVLGVSCVMLLAGLTSVSAASVKSPKLIKSEKVALGKDNVTVKTFDDNGVKITSVEGSVTDKAKAIEFLDQNQDNTASTANFRTVYNFDTEGRSSSNSDARTRIWGERDSWLTDYFAYSITGSSVKGRQTGTWMAADPANANSIVLHQKTKFSGYLLGFSWPPTYNKNGNTFTWDSQPVNNTLYVAADRPYVEATANSAQLAMLTGTKVTDSADVYVGSQIYRPQVVLSW
ncbi:hypothetical protein ACFFK0_04620 [Paenibacillus chartarius]|uniref:Uncharacterized protein n=1 Tax=Paenibacillus chartarius TaxID=747481 RepID=A0ABV6DGH3_9BACL